jgi:dihydroorotate dehydrogenase (NAD+) catalytic subunit
MIDADALDLSITFGTGRKGDPMRLHNPVIAASGTLGTGVELQRDYDLAAIGALVTPGITRRAQQRRPATPPLETPAGLFLSERFPALSLRSAVSRYASLWESLPVPVIANLPAGDADECVEIAAMLADHPGVAAIELGLVSLAPRLTGNDSALEVQWLCRRLSDTWPRPLIVKLPYGLTDTRILIDAATEGGADAISLGGGLPARVLNRGGATDWRRLLSGRIVGPAMHPLALHAVAAACAETRTPIIASGGVTSGADALAFLLAGAWAVQVGSASLRNPAAAIDVARDLEHLVRSAGMSRLQDIRAHTTDEGSPA